MKARLEPISAEAKREAASVAETWVDETMTRIRPLCQRRAGGSNALEEALVSRSLIVFLVRDVFARMSGVVRSGNARLTEVERRLKALEDDRR